MTINTFLTSFESKSFFYCIWHTLTRSERLIIIHIKEYRKIPKISPGAYIFQRVFLRGLLFEGLMVGGAYLRREICISKSIGLAL